MSLSLLTRLKKDADLLEMLGEVYWWTGDDAATALKKTKTEKDARKIIGGSVQIAGRSGDYAIAEGIVEHFYRVEGE